MARGVLEEYVLFKHVGLAWARRGAPPRWAARLLAERGVESIVDLDRLVHELHAEAAEELGRRAGFSRGDAELTEYVVSMLLGAPVFESRGDGYAEDGFIMVGRVAASFSFDAAGSADVLLDVEHIVGVLEFARDHLQEYVEECPEYREAVQAEWRGGCAHVRPAGLAEAIRHHLKTYRETDYSEDAALLCGPRDSVEDDLGLLEQAFPLWCAYNVFVNDTDMTIYRPKYAAPIQEALEEYAAALAGYADIRVSLDDVAPVHDHDDKAHIHMFFRAVIRAEAHMLPLLTGGLIAAAAGDGGEHGRRVAERVVGLARWLT